MPDMTMCNGENCPVKLNCYRFTAKPDYYQAYFSEPPWFLDVDKETKDCNYFWDNKGKNGSKDKNSDDGVRTMPSTGGVD